MSEAAATDSPTSSSPSGARAGAWVWLALGVACVSMAATVMMWQRLSWTQQELARRAGEVAAQSRETRDEVKQSTIEIQNLQAKLTLAEVKLAEVVLQRTQMEELLLSLSRSRDDNLVLDLEASVRLAYQQADFSGSPQPLIAALQAVSQRIERASQPRLNPVLRAVDRDLEKLQAAAMSDMPSLLQRLDASAQRIEFLPLANGAPPAVATDAAGPTAGSESQPMWMRWWNDALTQARALVRVSRIDRPEASVLATDQAYFLRGNIRLLVLNARVGILSRQAAVARADIQRTLNLLQRFFDQNHGDVQALQTTLTEVLNGLGELGLHRPDDTLTALATAAAGR